MAEQTFTPGQILTAAQMTTLQTDIGLNFILAQTIGTTVPTVTVASAFSSTYDNYRITISGGLGSGATDYSLQLTGITGNVYQTFGYFITPGTATLSAYAPALTSSWLIGSINTVAYSNSFDVMSPNLTKAKFFTGNGGVSTTGSYSFNGMCTSTTAATGFTLTANSSSTFSGGTIRVYGYRNS